MENTNPEKRKEGKASKKKPKTETEEKSNIRIVRHALEALNSGDISKVYEFISPQYFNHESQMDPVRSKLRGPEEFIDTVKNLRSTFTDLRYEEQETIASGDKVISVLTVTGKHTGNFFGIAPPTGNDISYQAVHIHRIGNDGKIVEHKAIRDDLTLMMQLGMVGPSSTQYEPLFQAWKGFIQPQMSQPPTSKLSADDESAIRSLYFQAINGWNKGSRVKIGIHIICKLIHLSISEFNIKNTCLITKKR